MHNILPRADGGLTRRHIHMLRLAAPLHTVWIATSSMQSAPGSSPYHVGREREPFPSLHTRSPFLYVMVLSLPYGTAGETEPLDDWGQLFQNIRHIVLRIIAAQ